MSPPGRPKGELAPKRDSAEGSPSSPPGRPKGELAPKRDSAEGSPSSPPLSPLRAALLGTAFALGVVHGVSAAAAERTRSVPALPQYQQECASCHIAYPPRMLPAASWQRLMGALSRHYGVDASMEAATAREIETWLTANAGVGKRAREAPPDDRITRSTWFLREHDEVAAPTWKMPAVESPANCSACHTQAERGDFDERNIRVPR